MFPSIKSSVSTFGFDSIYSIHPSPSHPLPFPFSLSRLILFSDSLVSLPPLCCVVLCHNTSLYLAIAIISPPKPSIHLFPYSISHIPYPYIYTILPLPTPLKHPDSSPSKSAAPSSPPSANNRNYPVYSPRSPYSHSRPPADTQAQTDPASDQQA